MKVLKIIVTILGFLIAVAPVNARDFNDKLMNRPYADLRCWHLGFSIGAHAEDIRFTHNGLITEQGEEWRIDRPRGSQAKRLFFAKVLPGYVFRQPRHTHV